MEEKYLQKQQEYTFTVPRAEGQKVYHFGARRFKLLAGAVLVCTVCMVGCKACWRITKKCCVICLKSRHWKLNCAGH